MFHLPTGISPSFPAPQSVFPGSSPSTKSWPSLPHIAPSKPGLLCLPHSGACCTVVLPTFIVSWLPPSFLAGLPFPKTPRCNPSRSQAKYFKEEFSLVWEPCAHVRIWPVFGLTMPWCVHHNALLPYRASQTTSITVCSGCILERVALPQSETLVSRLLNNSSVFPVVSQMPHVQWWGRKRMV